MTFEHPEYWYNLGFLKKDLRIKMLALAKEIFFLFLWEKSIKGFLNSVETSVVVD